MVLTKTLPLNCVKVPLEGKDKETAITELVDLLDSNGLLLDKETVLKAVMTREQIRSTGIGSRIAVPHGKCTAVEKLAISLGIAKEPIDFQSIDGKPVTIIILLVSPANQTGPHIQALAKISRLMLDEKFKEELEKATSSEEAYKLLCNKDKE